MCKTSIPLSDKHELIASETTEEISNVKKLNRRCSACKLVEFQTTVSAAINIAFYYMAVSHKDWELPNPRI